MKVEKSSHSDILFIDGLEPRGFIEVPSFLSYLLALAPVLESKSYTYKVFNISTLKDYSLSGIIEELNNISFKSIGMTTNAENISVVYKIIKIIKKHFPDIPIILGGSQATFSSKKILSETQCDIIVKHEGEYILIKVLDYYINNKGSLSNIKGISYKDHSNKIVETPLDNVLNIDDLPTPKYEILNNSIFWVIPKKSSFTSFNVFLKKIRQSNNVFMTGRGCPFICSFCVEGKNSMSFRMRKAELVEKDLIRFLENIKLNYITIGDDTFTTSLKRVKEITNIFLKIKISQKYESLIWFAEGRVDRLYKHPEMMELMVEAGLRNLQLGIESGNQRVLDIYNKKITLKQIKGVIKTTLKYPDLFINGNLILGNPFETYKEFLKSIDFAKELISLSNFKIDFGTAYLTPFVGTEIRENPDKFGISIIDPDFEKNSNSFIQVTCKPNSISISDLQRLKGYTEYELFKYYKENLWKLSKKELDRKWEIFTFYGSGQYRLGSNSWVNTINQLPAIKKYYGLYHQGGFVKSYNIDSIYKLIKMIPVRIWDLPFDIEKRQYRFTSLNGSEYIISDDDIFLYENANGIRTIIEILELKNIPSKINNDLLKQTTSFYISLELNFALIFKAY